MAQLSHLDEQGRARMVDVSAKDDTIREAVAMGEITMRRETLEMIVRGGQVGPGMAPSGATELEKGNVLATAQIAGIMAAKRTSELIPMCHPLPLSLVDVEVRVCENGLAITSKAATTAETGVEMEALVAVSVCALTLYDMLKGADKSIEIRQIVLERKSGGKSGEYRRGK